MSGNGLNSGYIGSDQRRTKAGSYDGRKHYLERIGEQFSFSNESWSPSLIPTALWLDANDQDTVILNGTTVSEWRDKSGNNRHATQTTATNQPTRLLNEQNGKTMIDWDGSNDSMILNGGVVKLNTVLSQDNSYSVAMVIKADVISNLPVLLHDPTNNFQFLIEINSPSGIYWGDTTSTFRTYSTGTFGSTTKATFFTLIKTGNGTGEAHTAGTLISSFAGNFGNTPTLNANMLLGSYSSAQYNYNGKFGEVIISVDSWDISTRQRIEGYLAHKWGLTADLPADHPYKNSAPSL